MVSYSGYSWRGCGFMRGLLWCAITVHDILLCFNWLPSQLYMFCLVQLKVAPSTHWEMQSRLLPTWRYSLVAMETFCKSQMLINCWKLQKAFQTSRAKSSRNNDHTTQESCSYACLSCSILYTVRTTLYVCTYTSILCDWILISTPVANCNVTSPISPTC